MPGCLWLRVLLLCRRKFVQSPLDSDAVHLDHEPTPNPSQEGNWHAADECLLPSWEGSGVSRFVETLLEFLLNLAVWFAPRPVLRRYRVTPRTNSAAFRHDLIRGIQLELHREGLVTSRQIPVAPQSNRHA